MIQLSLVRIRGYGPWTLTLGHDREHELQILQASVYGTLQRRLSDLGCLLFENRRDEFVAITNGLDRAGHEAAIRGIDPRVTLEASIGSGGTPLEADRAASLAGPGGPATGGDSACVMHLDVDGMTGRRGSSTAGGAAAEIAALHSLLWSDCMATGSLAFFMGGRQLYGRRLGGGAARRARPCRARREGAWHPAQLRHRIRAHREGGGAARDKVP